jgi:hypothetical protein
LKISCSLSLSSGNINYFEIRKVDRAVPCSMINLGGEAATI